MQLLTLENINRLNSLDKGIYRIYVYNSRGNQFEINRLLGKDTSGLIYIGSSQKNSIQYQLKCFLHSMDKNRSQNNHSGGLKICKNANLQDFLKDKQLMFDYIVEEKAMDLERELLNTYKNKFGEVPPLNG